jgi:hypothetical protein
MTLLTDLSDFTHSRHPHGPLTAHATEPAWNGYLSRSRSPFGLP